MTIIVTYCVDKDLYYASYVNHDISLVTTEYQYENELLVHLQMGNKLCARLNDRLSDLLAGGATLPSEQFLCKKIYTQGDTKLITRSTFEAKIKRFDMSQTVIAQEILEEYAYTDQNGRPSHVQIVMTDRGDVTIAVIDFEDIEQYENFVCPAWLHAYTSGA